MLVDSVGKGIQTGHSADGILCSVMSGPQVRRPGGVDDSVIGCIDDSGTPALPGFLGARMT